jgi:hypothetical protein
VFSCAEELYQSVLTFVGGTPQKEDLTAVLIKQSSKTNNRVELPGQRMP